MKTHSRISRLIQFTAMVLLAQAVAVSFSGSAHAEATETAARVLLIHSTGEYGGFKAANEFDADFSALSMDAGKIAIGDLNAAKLAGNDVVITGSMLLRTRHKTPYWESSDHLSFQKHGRELFDYLEGGGVLLITDALESRGAFSLSGLARGIGAPVSRCDSGLAGTFGDDALVKSPNPLASYQTNYDPFQICRRAAGKFNWGHFAGATARLDISDSLPGWAPGHAIAFGRPGHAGSNNSERRARPGRRIYRKPGFLRAGS